MHPVLAIHTSSFRADEIVPILFLSDVRSGVCQLESLFRFRVDGETNNQNIVLALGNQRIQVASRGAVKDTVGFHQLALSVPDVDQAMADCLARGGILARSMTPDGPLEISEFWENGIRYVFFEGPEGALIELCMKKSAAHSTGWGHDHIGVECSDLAASQKEFTEIGCRAERHYTLNRSSGTTMVSFLRFGRSTVELFNSPREDTPKPLVQKDG